MIAVIGMPVVLLLGIVTLGGVIVLITVAVFRALMGKRARRFGYPTTGAYLAAAPQSDEEKRDAVDLALKGLVICIVGIVFPPFILIGLVPLFYAGRKLAYSQLGLGLVDDPDHPER